MSVCRISMVWSRILVTVFLLSCSVPATAQLEIPTWRAAPQTDALELGSPRMDPGFAMDLDPGEWASSLTVTQFNSWEVSWHTQAVHRDLGRVREPVLRDALDRIELQFPEDVAWHIDVEGWRTDLFVSRGFADATVTLHVPWIEIGAPKWDEFGERFHSAFGLNPMKRDLFSQSETLIYLKDSGNRHIIEGREELNGTGIGDATIGLSAPLGRRWGASHVVAGTLQAPTGDSSTLHGSGGWDAGLSWFAAWKPSVTSYKAALGYTWLDPSGSLLGFERSRHLGHLILEVERPLLMGVHGIATIRVDSSPLDAIVGGYPGSPATFYRLSLARKVRDSAWVSFTVGNELLPQTGDEADWALVISAGSLIESRLR